MADDFNGIVGQTVRSQQQAIEVMNRLADVAQAGSVFSIPVVSGDYTIIAAAEVTAGLGFGFGPGGGTGPMVPGSEGSASTTGTGSGGAGGGGGGSMGRPVAVISVGPAGVKVEPIVDISKLGLTLIAVIAGLLMGRRSSRKLLHS